MMKRHLLVLGSVVVLGAGAALDSAGQALPRASTGAEAETIVEAVEVQQNQYLQKDTLLYYVSTKPGERYDENRLRADFRRLWDTGFLEDLLLDIRDGQRGKIVIFVVRERKRVAVVDYRGSKALTKTAIEDKLKEKEVSLKTDTFFDLGKARQVEAVILSMLQDAGRPFGSVKHELRPLGSQGVQVSFVITDGQKIRVKRVDFLGNRAFSDGRLRLSLKKIKQRGFLNLSWLTGHSTFTEERWQEEQERLQSFYLNRGYVNASIGQPVVSYFDRKVGLFRKNPTRFIKVEVPVHEGDQYRVGELKVEGLTVFKEEGVKHLFRKLKPGELYKERVIKKGYDKLRDWYGAQGYFNWTPLTKRTTDDEKKIVNVVLSMQEDRRYFFGRVAFTGNDMTRDKVVRRELYFNEGEVFNTESLKASIKRINQLGYFKTMEKFPDLNASSRGEDRVDVTFKLEEQNRNQIQVGGGVSGYEGTFVNSSFSTSNFLGKGETFQVSFQSGKRIKNYQVAVTEPFMFDRPITAGIDLYRRRYEAIGYQNLKAYVDDRIGGSVTGGLPLGRFLRFFTSYTYEKVKIEQLAEEVDLLTPYYDSTISYAYQYDDYGTRYESRLGPSLVYNTVDSPYTPRSGTRVTATCSLSGGPLGGSLHYVRPSLELVRYFPHTKHTALGMRAEGAFVRPFGDTRRMDPETGTDSLPFYHRFALGGEMQVRGYPYMSIAPANRDGTALERGDLYLLFNAEYYLDIGPARLLAFFDAGQAYMWDQRIDLKLMKISYGTEVRFVMPVLNVPFRLIYAINPNRGKLYESGVKRNEYKFAVGSTF
jgi:outer membrane protein insertion porin family